MPAGRYQFAAAVYSDKIWVLGGRVNSSVSTPSVIYFDGETWRDGPTLTNTGGKNIGMAAAVFQNRLYTTGGAAGTSAEYPSNRFWSLQPSWAPASGSSLPVGLSSHVFINYFGGLFAMGGFNGNGGNRSKSVYYSDGSNWSTLSVEMNVGRSTPASFVLNGYAYVVAGTPGLYPSTTDTVERFDGVRFEQIGAYPLAVTGASAAVVP
eukprot:m.28534 g.28534  ORF g.28534 m.28534 type:complete len:208 (-) comp11853_c0_seq2:96-719(-)